MKRKITRQSLDELAKELQALTAEEQERYYGGGDGSPGSPYSVEEYRRLYLSGAWVGGFVLYDSEPHYLTKDVYVVGSPSSKWGAFAQDAGSVIGTVSDAFGGYSAFAGKDYIVYNSQGGVAARIPIAAFSTWAKRAIQGGKLLGGALELVPIGYRMYNDGGVTKDTAIATVSTVGGMYIGGKAGAAVGALLTPVLGPVGAASGAVIGGALGGMLGGEVIEDICYEICDYFSW